MPEKLLTLEEVSRLLGVSEAEVEKLAKEGELPAYKIGGRFLRFRREQVEAIRNDIPTKPLPVSGERNMPYVESAFDRFLDFLYFNDFNIITTIIVFALLWLIFR